MSYAVKRHVALHRPLSLYAANLQGGHKNYPILWLLLIFQHCMQIFTEPN